MNMNMNQMGRQNNQYTYLIHQIVYHPQQSLLRSLLLQSLQRLNRQILVAHEPTELIQTTFYTQLGLVVRIYVERPILPTLIVTKKLKPSMRPFKQEQLMDGIQIEFTVPDSLNLQNTGKTLRHILMDWNSRQQLIKSIQI
jgi:hypothetical protein